MKIAIITSAFLPRIGGAEIFIHNFVNNLNSKNEVTLLIPFRYYIKIRKKVTYKVLPTFGIGLISKRLPFIKKFVFKIYFRILQKIYKFDVWNAQVATYSGEFISYGNKNVPKILTFHGADIQKSTKLNYGKRLDKGYEIMIKNSILPNIDLCTAISKSIKKELINLSYPADKIEIIPNGIDTESFKINLSENFKKKLRTKYRIPKSEFIILTTGRNHPKKGYIDIPYIASELEKINFSFKWILVGRNLENIKELTLELKVKNLIFIDEIGNDNSNKEKFSFPNKKIIELYNISNCYVFPTILESFGMVIIESFLAKLPVITTSVDGTEDFNSCIKIKRDDDLIKNFIFYIKKMKNEKDFSSKIIREQTKELLDFYTMDKVTNQYIKCYEKSIKKLKNQF